MGGQIRTDSGVVGLDRAKEAPPVAHVTPIASARPTSHLEPRAAKAPNFRGPRYSRNHYGYCGIMHRGDGNGLCYPRRSSRNSEPGPHRSQQVDPLPECMRHRASAARYRIPLPGRCRRRPIRCAAEAERSHRRRPSRPPRETPSPLARCIVLIETRPGWSRRSSSTWNCRPA